MRVPEPGPVLAPPVATVEPFPPALPLNPLPDVLAATGPGDDLLQWLIIAAAVVFIGWFVVAGFRETGDDK